MESTAPYSPAQNSIAERLNHILLEHARAMLFAKQVPKMIWPEAVAYACYIKNRTPMQALGMDTIPFEVFFGRKPNIGRLEEFGKKCWVQVPDQRHTKLDLKSEQHIFTGIALNAKAWRYYNVHMCHIQTFCNIIFDATDNAVHPCLMMTIFHQSWLPGLCLRPWNQMPMRGAVPGLQANLGLITTTCMRECRFCQQWRS